MKQLNLRFQQPSHDVNRCQPIINAQEPRVTTPADSRGRPCVVAGQGFLPFVDRGGVPLPAMTPERVRIAASYSYLQGSKTRSKRGKSREPLLNFTWTKTPTIAPCALDPKHSTERHPNWRPLQAGVERNLSLDRRPIHQFSGSQEYSRQPLIGQSTSGAMNARFPHNSEPSRVSPPGRVMVNTLQALISFAVLFCFKWRV
jgi:hypothetical protein